jgi:SAM-dependent methyltransferase
MTATNNPQPSLSDDRAETASSKMTKPEFDAYAKDYSAELNRVLAVTGESIEYYAEQRVLHVARRLSSVGTKVSSVLDFGCGTGTATPYFLRGLGANSVVGVDVSTESLQEASTRFSGLDARFVELDKFEAGGDIDLAFCNGVFHHILPDARMDALQTVFASLRPGGYFAFWENNPWNPGTRWLMSRTPIDRDAIVISPPQARRLLQSAGFRVLFLDSLFYFPRSLGWFRPLETMLSRLPLGGQYLALCVKDVACNTVREHAKGV